MDPITEKMLEVYSPTNIRLTSSERKVWDILRTTIKGQWLAQYPVDLFNPPTSIDFVHKELKIAIDVEKKDSHLVWQAGRKKVLEAAGWKYLLIPLNIVKKDDSKIRELILKAAGKPTSDVFAHRKIQID